METFTTAEYYWEQFLSYFGHDKYNIFVYGSFAWFFGIYWIAGSLFSYVDLTGKPKWMFRYKIQSDVKSYPISIETYKDLVKVLLINHIIVFPLLIMMYYVDKYRPIVSIGQLPTLTKALFDIIVSIIVIEVLFYYSHRILHHPSIYKYIHKKHHTWISPVAISALYCHPIEQVLSNLIPSVAGPFLLGSHITVLWTWIAIAILTTLITHSGYHLPFLPSAEAHDFHHLKFNYNFGVIGLLDRLHGTDALFKQSKESLRHRTLLTLTPAKELFP